MKPQDKEESAWISFACAALASGETAKKAANRADGMLEYYDERFQYSAAVALPEMPEPVAQDVVPETKEVAEEETKEVAAAPKDEVAPKPTPAKKTSKKTSARKPKAEGKVDAPTSAAEVKSE